MEKQGRAAYNTPKRWEPFPDPAYAGALGRVALFFYMGL